LTQKTTITAIFRSADAARRAFDDLELCGIAERRLSWMMSREVHARLVGEPPRVRREHCAARSAFAGALSAGAASLLASAGIVAGGPLGALAAACLSAAGGGVVGALIGAGLPRRSAARISSALPRGGVVVGVEVQNDDELSEVRRILERHGAQGRSETPSLPGLMAHHHA
jgi:hypothetical protein